MELFACSPRDGGCGFAEKSEFFLRNPGKPCCPECFGDGAVRILTRNSFLLVTDSHNSLKALELLHSKETPCEAGNIKNLAAQNV